MMAGIQDVIATEVDRQIKRILGTLQMPIMAQQDGTLVSDGHRTFNFQGGGVTVSDDPGGRRTTVYIPGAPTGSGSLTTNVLSTAGVGKSLRIGPGQTNTTAPANWFTAGFNDSSWNATADLAVSDAAFYVSPPSATWITNPSWTDGGTSFVSRQILIRYPFTLPAGTILSATLQLNVDDQLGSDAGGAGSSLYLNGTNIGSLFTRGPGSPGPYATISLTPSLLTAGASNLLAINDYSGGGAVCSSFNLAVSYTVPVPEVSTDLASNVTIPSGGTYADGPTVSLSAGTWLMTATATVTAGASGNDTCTVKLWDGTTVSASTEQTMNASWRASLSLSAIVSPTTTTTYKLSASFDNSAGTMNASSPTNGTPPKATHIRAVKIG